MPKCIWQIITFHSTVGISECPLSSAKVYNKQKAALLVAELVSQRSYDTNLANDEGVDLSSLANASYLMK